MDLGNAIKLCRVRRKLNQTELASLSGISVSYLSLLERGKRDPNFSTIQNIAEALRIPVSILIFLAAEGNEIENIDKELAEKLSHTALKLIEASNHEGTLL